MGMGDLKSLLEVANENINQRTFKTSISRMMTGKFDMQNLLSQMRQMHKMGKIGTIVKILPEMSKINVETIIQAEGRLKNAEILISSMTLEDRTNIRLFKHISRKGQVIKGSGSCKKDYNKLLNQFQKTRKQVDLMAKNFKNGVMPNIPGMSNFGA